MWKLTKRIGYGGPVCASMANAISYTGTKHLYYVARNVGMMHKRAERHQSCCNKREGLSFAPCCYTKRTPLADCFGIFNNWSFRHFCTLPQQTRTLLTITRAVNQGQRPLRTISKYYVTGPVIVIFLRPIARRIKNESIQASLESGPEVPANDINAAVFLSRTSPRRP